MTQFLVISAAALGGAQVVDAVSWSAAIEQAANTVLGSGEFVAIPTSEAYHANVQTALNPDSTVTPIT